MKKPNNNQFTISFLFLFAITLLISSCGRQNGSVSYNNEKLRKQSLEIENSKPSSAASIGSGNVITEEIPSTTNTEVRNEVLSKIEKVKNANHQASASAIEKGNEKGAVKMNAIQKAALKKIEKKLSPKDETSTQGGGVDQQLKLAIILAIVGIILMLFPWPISLLGWIALLIALILFLLWAMDNL